MLVYLFRPHTFLACLAVWGLVRLWRKRRDEKPPLLPFLVPAVLLAFLCTNIAAYLITLPLEARSPPSAKRPDRAEAVVVFAAGVYRPSGTRLRAELDEDSLHRCLHAARLHAQGPPCPVLVCGGRPDPEWVGPSYAAVLGELLVQLGVRPGDLVLEERPRNTHENAVEAARILQEHNVRRVALVVDAVDLPRAAACLRKQGVEVLPAACHYRATGFPTSVFAYVPSPGGAAAVERAWHEWLGLLWYRLRGRI